MRAYLRDVEPALQVHGARQLGRGESEDERDRIDPEAARRLRIVLVVCVRVACVHAESEVEPLTRERQRGGAAESVTTVVFMRLRSGALGEPAEPGWGAEPEVPHPLLAVQRGAPLEMLRQIRAQADALLRVPLEAAVGEVRDEVVLAGVVERGVEEACRGVRGQVAVDARLDCRARAEVVHDRGVEMTELISGVRAPAVLVESLHREDATRRTVVESGDEVSVGRPEGAAAHADLEAGESIAGPDVDGPSEREIPVERARRPLDDVQSRDDLREEQVQVVVALGVPVGRLVVRHAVDVHGDVGRVIGAEAANGEVGGEPRPLALLVGFESGGLPKEIPRRVRRSQPERERVDVDDRERLRPFHRRRGDGDLVEPCGTAQRRVGLCVRDPRAVLRDCRDGRAEGKCGQNGRRGEARGDCVRHVCQAPLRESAGRN